MTKPIDELPNRIIELTMMETQIGIIDAHDPATGTEVYLSTSAAIRNLFTSLPIQRGTTKALKEIYNTRYRTHIAAISVTDIPTRGGIMVRNSDDEADFIREAVTLETRSQEEVERIEVRHENGDVHRKIAAATSDPMMHAIQNCRDNATYFTIFAIHQPLMILHNSILSSVHFGICEANKIHGVPNE